MQSTALCRPDPAQRIPSAKELLRKAAWLPRPGFTNNIVPRAAFLSLSTLGPADLFLLPPLFPQGQVQIRLEPDQRYWLDTSWLLQSGNGSAGCRTGQREGPGSPRGLRK